MILGFDSLGVISLLITWVIILGLLLYVPRNRKPSSAVAWLLVIFFLPVVGLVLFALIGSPKLSNRRREQQKKIDTHIVKAFPVATQNTESKTGDIAKMNHALSGFDIGAAHSYKILADYDGAINDIVQDMHQAEKTIYLEYFILALDETTQPVFDAMERAVSRGVAVHVLFDAFGSKSYPRFAEMKSLLDARGVEWRPMLPIRLRPSQYNRPDLRNHRKIVTVDGRIGYIGSQNMVEKAYHRKDDIYYDELVIRVEGSIVRQLEAVFTSDWYFETNTMLPISTTSKKSANEKYRMQVVPSGSTYRTENNALLFTELFHRARTQIVITNPYFVPNEAILEAIKSAVYRGVDVKIINSQAMDQWMVGHAMRSFYKELLEAGVEIYLFKKPKLLHSKHITIDDDIAVIGSSNMDIRSFELNLECVLVAYEKAVVRDLKKVQKQNIKDAKRISYKTWSKRSFWKELRDSIARLTAALQ